MRNSPLRLDALIRQSQREEESRSPKQQLETCERSAANNGYTIATVHDSGRSESGKTMARGTVEAALNRIRDGRTDGVIVAWLDRFGRAPIEEAMSVLREIADAGGVFVPADLNGGRPIDPSDPQAETNLVIQLQIARQQWLTTANRFDRNRKEAIAAGKHIGKCPFGYRYTDPTPKPREKAGVMDSRLLVDPDRAPIVMELFERKAAGATWLELARFMDEAAPLPNGRQWSRQTVNGMIRNRTYLGEVRHGKHSLADAHEPIVPASLWRRAQNQPGRRTPRGGYLLTGLVKCSGCGRNMRASSGGTKKPAVYVCNTPECSLRYLTVVVAKIDAEVMAQVKARAGAFHLRAVNDDEYQTATQDVARLEDELLALVEIVVTNPKARAAHQARVSAKETELQAAEDRKAALDDARAASDGPILDPDALDTLTATERQEFLRQMVDAVLVRRASGQGPASVLADRIRVFFHGEAPADLMVRRGPVRSWAWDDGPGALGLAA